MNFSPSSLLDLLYEVVAYLIVIKEKVNTPHTMSNLI